MYRTYLWLAVAAIMMAGPVSAATLTVQVRGIRSDAGDIRVDICNEEQKYSKDVCTIDIVVPAQKEMVEVKANNLPPGTYAIQVLHDANRNKKMDYGFLGIPKEGFGFSNNARPGFSKPSWHKVKFDIGDTDVVQTIDLIHY